jgi:hypothetical protein
VDWGKNGRTLDGRSLFNPSRVSTSLPPAVRFINDIPLFMTPIAIIYAALILIVLALMNNRLGSASTGWITQRM